MMIFLNSPFRLEEESEEMVPGMVAADGNVLQQPQQAAGNSESASSSGRGSNNTTFQVCLFIRPWQQ